MSKLSTKMDTGIVEVDRKKTVEGLSRFLASTYTLYLQTHNFHWNVTGPMFQTLHLMFEQQYNELAIAVDLIAERIRALGFPTPATYVDFLELSLIKEERGIPSAERMIAILCEGQEVIIRNARETISITEKFHDVSTVDLLTERIQVHEKTAWMLRSLLV